MSKSMADLPKRYCEACGAEQRINQVRKQYNKYSGKLSLFVYYRCPEYRFWNLHNDNLEYYMDMDDFDGNV